MNNIKISKRILALDVLRGICIAGMALVNHPGNWKHTYTPLLHAEWHGITPTDLIFPFFLFIMGISTYISLRKYNFECTSQSIAKIAKRTLIIFGIGLALAWFGNFCSYWTHPTADAGVGRRIWESVWTFDRLRILGVMQRLALCYGLCSMIAVSVKHRFIPYISAVLLVGYYLLLLWGNGFEYGETNILSIVDRLVLTPAHMLNDNGIDPAGILSTIPALAQALLGFWVGRFFLESGNQSVSRDELMQRYCVKLFLVGCILTFIGLLLHYGCPINKKIWSPTFVLVTSGFASSSLALLIWIIDIKGYTKWSRCFEVFGINPLFMYVLGSVLGKLFQTIHFSCDGSIRSFLYKDCLVPLFGEYGGSLAYAFVFVFINWIIGYQLYKRKIYIKI